MKNDPVELLAQAFTAPPTERERELIALTERELAGIDSEREGGQDMGDVVVTPDSTAYITVATMCSMTGFEVTGPDGVPFAVDTMHVSWVQSISSPHNGWELDEIVLHGPNVDGHEGAGWLSMDGEALAAEMPETIDKAVAALRKRLPKITVSIEADTPASEIYRRATGSVAATFTEEYALEGNEKLVLHEDKSPAVYWQGERGQNGGVRA